MNITRTALSRPVAVTVLTVAVATVGIFSLGSLEVDYLPKITYPMIKIHVWWRGATAEEVETNVADPIERAMATVDNLDYLSSSSIEGMYTLLVNFKYGVNVDVAYQDVTAVMGRVMRNLPRDIDPPFVIKADPSQLPVMEVAVSSPKRSLVWLRDWAENWLTDRLNAVEGTAGVEPVGGLVREIRVHLDPRRLEAYGLTPAAISARLLEENVEMFGGRITVGRQEIIARTMAEFEDLDEIRNVVVATGQGGREVRLRDVGAVEDSHEEMRVNTRFNGTPCIKLNVLKQAEANTVKLAAAIKRRLDELREQIPADITFGYVENQGDYVMGAITSVRDSAILAALLVVLVVYLFLGRWRQVLVMVIALPVTLLANFFVMKTAGFSLNLFSLGGLVVALGVILDNSIVVMENISRLHTPGGGVPAEAATTQVSSAIVASTLTFLAIFLPFLFVPGLSSLLFRELVLVIASVVVISMAVALTLTPALAAGLLKGQRQVRAAGVAGALERATEALAGAYGRLLARVLRVRLAVVTITGLLFALGIYLAAGIGSEFLPRVDDGRVMVKVKMPAGTALAVVDTLLRKVEMAIQEMPDIQSTFTLAGGKVWGLATYEIANEGELDIQLVPKARRRITTAQFIEKIRPMVASIPAPGGKMPVMQIPVKGIRKVSDQEVEVKVKGADIEGLFAFAKQAAVALGNAGGLTNVQVSMDMSKPEYRVSIDRARASALGISPGDVARTLRSLITGTVASDFREGAEYYGIRVMVPERHFAGRQDVEWLVLKNENGRPIYLRDIAEVRRSSGPVEIVRENQIRQVVVGADPEGVSVGEAANRARAAVAALERPGDVTFQMGGQEELMRENRRTMSYILLFSSLFAFVILAVQFESFTLPLLIMLMVPFALTGAFIALYLTGGAVGVTVQVGLVVMMGGITSQGVVLLSMAEEYRRRGMSRLEAIASTAPTRLRPILMTQLTTVLGLLPLALNLGEGGDMLKPMAIAVIGGLLYSLFLSLFFLPSAYALSWRRPAQSGRAPRGGTA